VSPMNLGEFRKRTKDLDDNAEIIVNFKFDELWHQTEVETVVVEAFDNRDEVTVFLLSVIDEDGFQD
jgi:hypothetical protein